MESKLRRLAEELFFDWSSAEYHPDSGLRLTFGFELTPGDFLEFARQDLDRATTRGYVNALTNAKRCIDCAVDTFIEANQLMNLNKEEKESAYRFIEDSAEGSLPHTIPFKFRLIHALGIAPSNLVARYRSLRNKLEHEYRTPSPEEAKEATELAQLFSLAVNSAMWLEADFWVQARGTDEKRRTQKTARRLRVGYSPEENRKFEIFPWQLDPKSSIITLAPSDPEYFPLLKLAIVLARGEGTGRAHRDLLLSMGMQVDEGVGSLAMSPGEAT